ncbi:MAG: hypothetical protein KGL39_23160 [Patescibacteria group bacterium]|nr:hypothetical protein [Patescibacteria group bacterium]
MKALVLAALLTVAPPALSDDSVPLNAVDPMKDDGGFVLIEETPHLDSQTEAMEALKRRVEDLEAENEQVKQALYWVIHDVVILDLDREKEQK